MLAAAQTAEAEGLVSLDQEAAVKPAAPAIPKVISHGGKDELSPPVLSPPRLESPEKIAAAPASGAGVTAAWPDEQAEAVYLSEARDRGELPPPLVPKSLLSGELPEQAEAARLEKAPLPSLEELVQKIPLEIRRSLEELFRAKFVSVKRIPKKNLKS